MESVDETYRHYDKRVSPGEMLRLGDTTVKWYSIAEKSDGIPPNIVDLARTFLERESAARAIDGCGSLGFVILHRCGQEFYFLLLMSWKNSNELWESVYAKRSESESDFGKFRFDTEHRGTFCVWELAAVLHEKDAWKRFLLSRRDSNATSAYLSDSYSGIA